MLVGTMELCAWQLLNFKFNIREGRGIALFPGPPFLYIRALIRAYGHRHSSEPSPCLPQEVCEWRPPTSNVKTAHLLPQ
jgi:hypothetical protein